MAASARRRRLRAARTSDQTDGGGAKAKDKYSYVSLLAAIETRRRAWRMVVFLLCIFVIVYGLYVTSLPWLDEQRSSKGYDARRGLPPSTQ